jgi:hypothetical protein
MFESENETQVPYQGAESRIPDAFAEHQRRRRAEDFAWASEIPRRVRGIPALDRRFVAVSAHGPAVPGLPFSAARRSCATLPPRKDRSMPLTAPLQTIWDCRFSRLRPIHLTGAREQPEAEMLWACIRRGERRRVTDDECARCAHWEEQPAPAAWA